MKEIAACVLVFDRWPSPRKVLAVSNGADLTDWGLPGGGIESGETSEVAARRELREETGLGVRRFIKIFTGTATGGSGRVVTYLALDRRGKIRGSDEGVAAWRSWSDLFRGRHGEYNRRLWRAFLRLTSDRG